MTPDLCLYSPLTHSSSPHTCPAQEWEALQQSIQRRERALLETKSKVTHPVYSLYFPEEKQEWWWLYIADRRDQTLVSMPYHVCTLKDTEEVSLCVSPNGNNVTILLSLGTETTWPGCFCLKSPQKWLEDVSMSFYTCWKKQSWTVVIGLEAFLPSCNAKTIHSTCCYKCQLIFMLSHINKYINI